MYIVVIGIGVYVVVMGRGVYSNERYRDICSSYK